MILISAETRTELLAEARTDIRGRWLLFIYSVYILGVIQLILTAKF